MPLTVALPADKNPLLLPARRRRPLQLLQHYALTHAAGEDLLHDVGRKQREPQDSADILLERFSVSPMSLTVV